MGRLAVTRTARAELSIRRSLLKEPFCHATHRLHWGPAAPAPSTRTRPPGKKSHKAPQAPWGLSRKGYRPFLQCICGVRTHTPARLIIFSTLQCFQIQNDSGGQYFACHHVLRAVLVSLSIFPSLLGHSSFVLRSWYHLSTSCFQYTH